MSYCGALEIAGATVERFKEFGSYQGDWWAKVTYNNQTGWVNGSYGSCSGCDAFQGEFDIEHHECGDDDYFNPLWDNKFNEGCEKCSNVKARLIAFGAEYLSRIYT